MDIRFGKVIDSPEQLHTDASSRDSLVVLFNVEDGFLDQEVYRSYGGSRWYQLDPEEYDVRDRAYTKQDLFAIAQHREKTVVLLNIGQVDNDVPTEPVTTRDALSTLPRFSLLRLNAVNSPIVVVKIGRNEWWDCSDFVDDSGFTPYRDEDLLRFTPQVLWAPVLP